MSAVAATSSINCRACVNPIKLDNSDLFMTGWAFKHFELVETGMKCTNNKDKDDDDEEKEQRSGVLF
jgi:hypothetical protein